MKEFESIIEAVSVSFDIGANHILGKSRVAHIVLARHVAMYVMHQRGMTFSSIGKHFSKDHATISHAFERIKNSVKRDVALAAQLAKVQRALLTIPKSSMDHGIGFIGEIVAAQYIRDLSQVDAEWCFKYGVRFEDGWLVNMQAIEEKPIGSLSIVVEYESKNYKYLFVKRKV